MKDVALVVGTKQNLSNLYSLDIYECNQSHITIILIIWQLLNLVQGSTFVQYTKVC